MAIRKQETIKQDGESWNPKAFQSITEEQAIKRFPEYKPSTITAVWKCSNGFSVKTTKRAELKSSKEATTKQSKKES